MRRRKRRRRPRRRLGRPNRSKSTISLNLEFLLYAYIFVLLYLLKIAYVLHHFLPESELYLVSKLADLPSFCLQAYMMLLVVWFLLGLVPWVAAAPKQDPFPNMLFTEFAQSIQDSFGPKIKLSTVLMLLMTLVNNTDLLNLHGQQGASF